MNTAPQNEFPIPKDSYVAFDAISLRNLILKRLDEQGIYTDHNYIGSNLASIIDIVAFSYNTLMYYLHKTSTESLFSEAQLYENINKIVKILDYKPVGYQTSTLSFKVSALSMERGVYAIPRYSFILIGEIPFSYAEDVSFVITESFVANELTEVGNKKLLYQGVFRENPLYTAAGDQGETVLIQTTNSLIDHLNIHVYVYEQESEKWVEYKEVTTLQTERASSRSYEKRLNSDKLYEITFGDDINGRKLNADDLVQIYYLQSTGSGAVVGPGILQGRQPFAVLFNTPNYNQILTNVNTENFNYVNSFQFSSMRYENAVGSTIPKDIETVDEIKKNAPGMYRSQYRLVTKNDYEVFVRVNFANIINDVKIFDNFEYTSQYLKYFKDIQQNPAGFNQILLNQVQYSDSCNFNNIYICATPRVSEGSTFKYLLPAQKDLILNQLNTLKVLGSEITFAEPIFKAVGFGVNGKEGSPVVESQNTTLEIIKNQFTKKSSFSIIQETTNVLKNFLDLKVAKIGGKFNHASIASGILGIEGVDGLRTRRNDTNEVLEGLGFVMWNPNYPEQDKRLVSSNLQISPFELVYFPDISTISTKIIVVES